MSASVFWYADAATRGLVDGGKPAVLLLGGYQGYANFGDVVQLKGAIRFHREKTGLEPVILCDLASLTDRSLIERMRAWFGVDGLLFWSFAAMTVDGLGLAPLESSARIAHLHMYGGGFLNRTWGAGMLALAEAAHGRFGVGHYVIGGQQVAEDFVPSLREHLARFPVVLAGGRDAASVRALSQCGVSGEDSFDDSAEVLAERVSAFSQSDGEPSDLLLHLNISPYTRQASGDDGLARCAKHLATLNDHLRKHAPARPPRVTLLASYSDRRVDRVMDSLCVVQQLEDRFPFNDCRMVDLAGLALRWSAAEASTSALRLRAGLALSCSYHTALLCGLLGVPCFLLAENDYYSQKLRGLGFAEQSLGAFLERRPTVDFSSRLEARRGWLEKLEAAYRKIPPRDASPVAGSQAPTGELSGWKPKPGLIEMVGRLECVERELRAQRAALAVEGGERERLAGENRSLSEKVERLAGENQALGEEAERLSRGWAAQKTFIEELERVRDSLWNEVQASQAECRELKGRLERLEQAIGRLERQLSYRLLRRVGVFKGLAGEETAGEG